MKDSLRTIVYATVLGVVCALLLTATARFTAPYKENNAKAEKMRCILGVLDVPFPAKAASEELVSIFDQNVRREQRGGLTVYIYAPVETPDEIEAMAVAFGGSGVWGPIKGFLSLESDMKTVRSIIFHEQEETPGLGGEIASDDFRGQFKGKTIVDETGKGGLYLVRNGASAANEVDAITGATMTCTKVEAMINATIDELVRDR